MSKSSPAKMKLLFITEFFPCDERLQFSGGVEAHNFYLLKELAKKHQVTVICRRLAGQTNQKTNWDLKIIRLGKRSNKIDTSFSTLPGRLAFIFKSIEIGLKQDFDLVQGNNFVTFLPAFIIGWRRKKPTVAWYPDVFVGQWFTLTGFASGLVGEVSERLSLILPWSKIISLSISTTEKLIEQRVKVQKIITIPGGVDVNLFVNIKVKKEPVFTICYIGRLVKYKRVDLLIRAAQILKKRKVRFKIKIIGQGLEDFSLKLLAQELEVENIVNFQANLSREDLAQTLKSYHLFCLPSEQEGFGLVVMEAASCSLPSILSDIKVLREITHGQGALFFKKGDAHDLANKIQLLIKNKKKYQQLAKQAFETTQEYDWKKVAAKFEMAYQQILFPSKKILMLVDAWFPHVGGGQIHVWELAKRLANKGCLVTIFTRDLGVWNQTYPGIKVIRIGHFKKFANIFGRLEYLILALGYSLFADFDLWHAHAFSPGLLTPLIKIFRNQPTVFTAHGSGLQIAGLNINGGFLEDLVFYKMPYDAEITVAKNTFTRKTQAKKLIVIPNGVNINDWIKAQRKRKKIKHLLYVGRVVFDKGLDLLIESIKDLKGLDLTVVGEGDQLSGLKKRARGQKIKFTGRLEGQELVKEFEKSDLLVMPSRVEGMPLRLLEAWAAKLPVVATRVGDNEIFIKDGQTGFLADVATESIYQGIMRAQNSNLSLIAENGWRNVQKFTWEKIANQTLKVYQEVLDEKAKS